MVHFEWKPEYSVNVKILDEQHQKLIKTIDSLYQSILNSETKEYLLEVFKQINEYTKDHFALEEKYFKDFDYKEADIHTAVHEKFKKDILDMETQINDEKFSSLKLLIFLENWWINHILDMDKKYVENFNHHGLK